MRTTHQAEIRPTPRQRQALLRHAGTARWAYNWGLTKRKEAHKLWVELGKPKAWKGWPNAISLHKELVLLKHLPLEEGGVPWMYESSKCAPQEALRNLDKAFDGFLKGRTKYPKFKSRNKGIGGFRLTGTVKSDHKTIQLPNIGRIRFQPGEYGYLPFGKHSQVSVTERAGRWFVSVVGPELPEALPNGKETVGLDLGVAQLATLSSGVVFENPRALSGSQTKIKRLSKSLSRKMKGSANRGKAKTKLARAHARVTNVRTDALHKVTTILTKNHGRIMVEDLNVKGMTRGSRGKGRRAKAGLNRSVLDASFGEFRRLLEYKGKLYGCEIKAVPAPYTSQRCSSCGHTEKGNRLSQRDFLCLSCGHRMNADLNAAQNILKLGLRKEAASSSASACLPPCGGRQANACGEDVRPSRIRSVRQTSVKQEPKMTISRDGSDWGLSSQEEAIILGQRPKFD